LLQITSKK